MQLRAGHPRSWVMPRTSVPAAARNTTAVDVSTIPTANSCSSGRSRISHVTIETLPSITTASGYLDSEIGNPVEVCPSNFPGPDE